MEKEQASSAQNWDPRVNQLRTTASQKVRIFGINFPFLGIILVMWTNS